MHGKRHVLPCRSVIRDDLGIVYPSKTKQQHRNHACPVLARTAMEERAARTIQRLHHKTETLRIVIEQLEIHIRHAPGNLAPQTA